MGSHTNVDCESNDCDVMPGALTDPGLLPAPRVRSDLPATVRTRPKVLVVDDDAAMRDVIEEFLLEEGYDVATAPNVFTGLIEALAGKPDVILLDWKMPGLDGFRLLQSVERCIPDVPVIFVSGYIRPEVSLHALELGAAAVLSKPFALERLLTEIQDALEPLQPDPGGRRISQPAPQPDRGAHAYGSFAHADAEVLR